MSFMPPLETFVGMFHCLIRIPVPDLVIFFPVVRVCGEFGEFCSSLVRVIWHGVSHPRCPPLSWNYSIFKTVQLGTLAPRPAFHTENV
jgi:hypothetical protein